MIRRSVHKEVKPCGAIAAAIAFFILAACGGGAAGDGVTSPTSPTAPPAAPANPYPAAAGTYTLFSVNGSLALPTSVTYTTPAPGGRYNFTSGSMILRADKTFLETFRFTIIPASGASVPDSDLTSGTFTLSAGTIVFTTLDPPPAHSWSGTLDASGTIAYNDQGFQAGYKK